MTKETNCCFCSTIILFGLALFLTVFLSITSIDYSRNNVLEEHICEVTRVDYPTTLPIIGDVSNWQECDCGKRCMAWGPTVSLYTNVSNQVVHTDVRVNYEINFTFFNYTCPNGEDARYTQIYLENVRSIAMSYINTTIPCYYSELNSNVYLNKNDDLPALIGYSTGLGVVVILVIILFIDCQRNPIKYDSEFV